MFVQINRLRLNDAMGERFEQAFANSAAHLSSYPGFVSFRLLRATAPVDGERIYLAEATWQDEESYRAWLKSPAFAAAHSGDSRQFPAHSTLEDYTVVSKVLAEQ